MGTKITITTAKATFDFRNWTEEMSICTLEMPISNVFENNFTEYSAHLVRLGYNEEELRAVYFRMTGENASKVTNYQAYKTIKKALGGVGKCDKSKDDNLGYVALDDDAVYREHLQVARSVFNSRTFSYGRAT